MALPLAITSNALRRIRSLQILAQKLVLLGLVRDIANQKSSNAPDGDLRWQLFLTR
jgi:hypothetical protein